MRAVFAIIGVIIILLLFGSMLIGIDSAQTDSRTDTFTGVTTAVGVSTAPVILVTDLYNNDILNVTSIVSTNTLDAPLPLTYAEATNTLTVRGLAPNDTRSLTVTYTYDALGEDSQTIGTFLGMMPMLVAIAAIVILVAAGIGAYSYARNRGY